MKNNRISSVGLCCRMKPPLMLLVVAVIRELVDSRGSVKLTPDFAQFWEYQPQVSVSCEDLGPEDWTVWRFTKSGDLSECGSGWGSQTRPAVCELKTLKPHDSGLYWCESKYRDVSLSINITVTGGPVILESPVSFVSGQDVVLSCKFRSKHQDLNVDFYRDRTLLKSSPENQTTVQLNPDHQGEYYCGSGGQRSPPLHMFIQDSSSVPLLLLHPDAEQIFEYSSVTFTCEPQSEGWTVKRHSSTHSGFSPTHSGSECGSDWGFRGAGVCVINTTKKRDSALYWCGKNMRRSGSVQLKVIDGGTVLQIPVHPVSSGQSVSLTCQHLTDPASSARFYRDGHFLSEQPAGQMILQQVALSDEAKYECEIRGKRSESSWLRVRPVAPPVAEQGVAQLSLLHLRYLLVFAPYIASTVLFISIYRQTGGRSIVQRRRRREMDIEPQYEDVIPDVTTEYQF